MMSAVFVLLLLFSSAAAEITPTEAENYYRKFLAEGPENYEGPWLQDLMAPSLVGSNDDCVVGPGGTVVCHGPLRPPAGRRLLLETQTPPGIVPVGGLGASVEG